MSTVSMDNLVFLKYICIPPFIVIQYILNLAGDEVLCGWRP